MRLITISLPEFYCLYARFSQVFPQTCFKAKRKSRFYKITGHLMYLSKNCSSVQNHTCFLQFLLVHFFKRYEIESDIYIFFLQFFFVRFWKRYKKELDKKFVCDIKCLVVQVAAAAITMPSFVSTLKRLLVIIRWLLVV